MTASTISVPPGPCRPPCWPHFQAGTLHTIPSQPLSPWFPREAPSWLPGLKWNHTGPPGSRAHQGVVRPGEPLTGAGVVGGCPREPLALLPSSPSPGSPDADRCAPSPAMRSCRSAGKRSLRFGPPSPSWCCFSRDSWARVTKRWVEAGCGWGMEPSGPEADPGQALQDVLVSGGPSFTSLGLGLPGGADDGWAGAGSLLEQHRDF